MWTSHWEPPHTDPCVCLSINTYCFWTACLEHFLFSTQTWIRFSTSSCANSGVSEQASLFFHKDTEGRSLKRVVQRWSAEIFIFYFIFLEKTCHDVHHLSLSLSKSSMIILFLYIVCVLVWSHTVWFTLVWLASQNYKSNFNCQ